ASLGRNVHHHSDTGRSYGTQYWYRVRAVNQSGNSPYSNIASAVTLTAVSLRVSGYPASTGAGSPGQLSVTALDARGNIATGYPGTIGFASPDVAASLPANATLPGATATFEVTLRTAGLQSISAQDTVSASLTGIQSGISVSAAAASRLSVQGYPTSITAGTSGNITGIAFDPLGNDASGYAGPGRFGSSDERGSPPLQSTLSSGTGRSPAAP